MSNYILYGVTILLLILSYTKDKKKTKMALKKAWKAFENIFPQFLVVLLFVGVLLAVLGSAAAGPLYGAFPVAAVFMKKGVKFSNIMIFIGAWSTTKIPMLLFEISALGIKFALTRLLVDIPGIILIALVLSKLTPKDEVKKIYESAEANTK